MKINKRNAEGYNDPTAHEALTNVCRSEMGIDSVYSTWVYVCSPYDTKNTNEFIRFIANQKGIPIIAGLMYCEFLKNGIKKEQAMVTNFKTHLIEKCSDLWVFGGAVDEEMAREIRIAKKRKMNIRWFDSNMKEVREYV